MANARQSSILLQKAQGFSHEAVLRAARYTLRQGSSRFEDVGVRLQAWARQALYTPEAIDAFLARRRQDAQTLRAVFEAAGIGRQPAAADFRLAEQWRLKGYRTDVLLVAAEGARNAGDPMRYIDHVVSNWAERGVATPEAARAERERWAEGQRQRAAEPAPAAPRPDAPARPSKEVGAHRFTQRAYTDEELDALLYTDLDDLKP